MTLYIENFAKDKRKDHDFRVYDTENNLPNLSVFRGSLLECEAFIRLKESGKLL